MGEMGKNRNERVKERREFLRAEFFNACADNGLRGFLEERAYGHAGCYYQYTGVSALCGMIDSGVIHLSRARELNDLNEIERPHVGMWDRVYIASFSYRKRESMAMWGLYCDPFADAVRLHFPLPALRTIVGNAGERGVIPLEWDQKEGMWCGTGKPLPVKSARMTDVVYKTKNTLQWKSYSFPLSKNERLRNAIRNGELLGQVKNSAWNYENEVRLIVELAETVRVSDCPKRIAVPYGELLEELGVLCGPCNTASRLRTKLGDKFEQAKGKGAILEHIEESHFKGQVHIQSRCKNCDFGKPKGRGQCPVHQMWPFVE